MRRRKKGFSPKRSVTTVKAYIILPTYGPFPRGRSHIIMRGQPVANHGSSYLSKFISSCSLVPSRPTEITVRVGTHSRGNFFPSRSREWVERLGTRLKQQAVLHCVRISDISALIVAILVQISATPGID